VLVIDEGVCPFFFSCLSRIGLGFHSKLIMPINAVSMVDGDLFDKLARIGSMLRKKIEPFGGIQVRCFFSRFSLIYSLIPAHIPTFFHGCVPFLSSTHSHANNS